MRRVPRRAPAAPLLLLWVAAAVSVLAAQMVWRGHAYWNFSDGVYLETSRLLLEGQDLYGQVAAAQPPALFLAGAAILSASTGLTWVHAVLSLVCLVNGVLVAVVVRRLTARTALAALAGLTSLVVPWTVRGHLDLTPESFAAPLLLGAALLGVRRETAVWAGVVAALAVAFKLAFLLPVLALILVAPAACRARLAAATGATLLAGSVGAVLVWGGALVDGVVRAQAEVGFQPDVLPGYLVQAAWNVGPLALAAAPLLRGRSVLRDQALLRSVVALAAAGLLLVGTVLKRGSYLNVIQVVEPALVILVFSALAVTSTRIRLAQLLLLGLVLAQSVALVRAPEDPRGFSRPFSAAAGGWVLSGDEVAARVTAARACGSTRPYSGDPYLAFLAGRRMPGDQADLFIVRYAPAALAPQRARQAADQDACP